MIGALARRAIGVVFLLAVFVVSRTWNRVTR